jgi:hypothetical protein
MNESGNIAIVKQVIEFVNPVTQNLRQNALNQSPITKQNLTNIHNHNYRN